MTAAQSPTLSATWAISQSPLTGMTVEATRIARLGTFKIGGGDYGPGATSRPIRVDHDTVTTRQVELTPSGTPAAITVAGWFEVGPNNAPDFTNDLFDNISLWDNGSAIFCVLQLNKGAGNELETDEYALYIHTDGTDSPTIVVTPQAVYWYSLTMDVAKGMAHLTLYDSSGVFVQAAATPFATSTNVARMEWGNGQTGVSANTQSYFESIIVNLSGVYPIGPLGFTPATDSPQRPSIVTQAVQRSASW